MDNLTVTPMMKNNIEPQEKELYILLEENQALLINLKLIKLTYIII